MLGESLQKWSRTDWLKRLFGNDDCAYYRVHTSWQICILHLHFMIRFLECMVEFFPQNLGAGNRHTIDGGNPANQLVGVLSLDGCFQKYGYPKIIHFESSILIGCSIMNHRRGAPIFGNTHIDDVLMFLTSQIVSWIFFASPRWLVEATHRSRLWALRQWVREPGPKDAGCSMAPDFWWE